MCLVQKYEVKMGDDTMKQAIAALDKYVLDRQIPVDGFIIQPNDSYDSPIFKWKPLELCTTDFLVRD
jgi:hypothetical protein